MTWMTKLYETYEQAMQMPDLLDEQKPMPISHTPQTAHINIVIDSKGNFKNAEALEKTKIVLPATEESAGRSSGEAPHALADKLQYVAKDYTRFGGTKKSYFDSYQKQLHHWCQSEFSHPKAQAVFRYIEKGTVIEDLIRANVLHVDNNNQLLTRWENDTKDNPAPLIFKILPKEKGQIEQGNALVCWTVEVDNEPTNAKTWLDTTLQQSWINFISAQDAAQGFCFVTGNDMPLATSHPAKLRHTGDKAKLISSNDTSGYTYRGKFIDDSQACGIGFEVTQKAHNALRWLINDRKQSYRNNDQVIIAWATSGKPIPSPLITTCDFLYGNLSTFDTNEIVADQWENPVVNHGLNLGAQFAAQIKKKLAGYYAEIKDYKNIIIMALDSATPGRMAISYYRETSADDFFERLEAWHSQFAWPQRYLKDAPEGDKKNKPKVIWAVSAPIPSAIIEAAYGKKLSESLKKKTLERLIPCIIEEKQIPKDLVDACIRNASNRNAYTDEVWLWRKNISIACALYIGFCLRGDSQLTDTERRKFDMSLDRECDSRDYLYGRLLAVAEQIERKALDNKDKKRITNAEGLMQRFSFNPAKTWPIIHNHLLTYKNHLKVSQPGLFLYWDHELQEILGLFAADDYNNPKPLSGEYLLGYYCQKNYRKPKKTKEGELIDPTENEINPEEI